MRIIVAIAFTILAVVANADDYVGRALNSCEPLRGRPGHAECIDSAANDICKGLQSPYDRLACHEDFERYYSAQVQLLKKQRQEAAETTKRILEQMQRPSQ